jgi:flagellar M-ring protein FliF
MSLFKNLVIGLGFLALILFVVRPLLSSLRSIRPAMLDNLEPLHEGGENKIGSVDRAQIAMQMSEQKSLIDQAKKDPYQVAQILQNWIEEDK